MAIDVDADVNINRVTGVDAITLNPLNINPFTIDSIKRIEKIAPAAVHIKELNQIAPISVDSLRVDHIRHVDPLRVERFNVTHLPIVNLSLEPAPSARPECPARAAGYHRAWTAI